MNDKQKQISKLLWDFQSLREEHVYKLCNCEEKDIIFLIASKVIKRDNKSKILNYNNGKEINNRNVIVFDVVMQYLNRNPKVKKAKFPISVSMQTDYYSYDIIAIKEIEKEVLFEKLDEISKSERVIIIIETKGYVKEIIKTKRPCYICTYPSIEIVDRIN